MSSYCTEVINSLLLLIMWSLLLLTKYGVDLHLCRRAPFDYRWILICRLIPSLVSSGSTHNTGFLTETWWSPQVPELRQHSFLWTIIYSTWYLLTVSHQSINQSWAYLASTIRQDMVPIQYLGLIIEVGMPNERYPPQGESPCSEVKHRDAEGQYPMFYYMCMQVKLAECSYIEAAIAGS